MRLLLSISAIWLMIALLIGVIGTVQLDGLWRSAEDRLLVSDASLIVSICDDTDWQEPWESDPRWAKLESTWDVDIIPIFGDQSDDSSVDSAVDLRGLALRDNASVEVNEWTRLLSGQWRISRPMALGNSSNVVLNDPSQAGAKSVIGVRVTRMTSFSKLHRIWWSLWGATFLLGCFVTWLTIYTLRQHRHKRQTALQPWVDAAQQITNSRYAQLPQNIPNDDEMAVQLSILRDAINAWLGDLQNSIQRNELVLSNLQEGVLAVDDKSRVLLANAAIVRLLGISTEGYLYRSLVEVIRTPRVVSIIERVLKSSTPQEESFEHGSQQLSLRVLVRPVQLGSKRVGALMTVRDETLLKRIESVRRDFITNASHELKTPLAAIRAYAETLQMGAIEDSEAAQNFLAGILAQADRINGLITGMLQLARVQTGGAALKRLRFDVLDAIETCWDAAQAMAKSKSIELIKDLPDAPLFMEGDPEGVKTVVSNLLSNAIRYTPLGGHVSLRLSATGTGLTIRVQDNGIGIEKEELSRIFERFYRVERARTADTGGTGLGLSIVKHLLQSLGGSVTVTSEPNVGSCFEVYLPLIAS